MPELTADDEFFNLLRVPADDELYSADEEPEWMKSEPAETHLGGVPPPIPPLPFKRCPMGGMRSSTTQSS